MSSWVGTGFASIVADMVTIVKTRVAPFMILVREILVFLVLPSFKEDAASEQKVAGDDIDQ